MTEVKSMCHDIRKIYEMLLASSGVHSITGSCMYASILLRQSLDNFGGCDVRICGGDGENDGGAADVNGKWHGHYWVEGRTASGFEFIADITADQFGFEPVVLMSVSYGRCRYVPGNNKTVQDAVDEIELEIQSAIELHA